VVASLGYHTVSFEASLQNALLWRFTRCEHLDWNMTFYNQAVGDYKNCGLRINPNNEGDYQVVCDEPGDISIDIIQLDRTDLLKYTFGVAKIDTQASEGMIMKGGYQFFKNAKIPYILSEYWPSVLLKKGTDPIELLNAWHSLGYDMRDNSFKKGKIIPPELFFEFYLPEKRRT